MGSLRLVFFASCFSLGFLLAACAGSGKEDATSIMKASGAGPAFDKKQCEQASASDTQTKKDSCAAAGEVEEENLKSTAMKGSPYCVAGFSANVKSTETKKEISELVDGQDGTWELTKVQTYVDIKDTTTQEVNQLAGSTTEEKLVEGVISEKGAQVTCHTSLGQSDGGQKVSATSGSMEDWNALQTHTDFPVSINRKDGSITTRRYDYWKADREQVKTASKLKAEASQIGSSSEQNNFAGVNDVTIAMNESNDGFDVIVKNSSIPDGKHQVIVFTRATYKGTQVLTEKPATETADPKDQDAGIGSNAPAEQTETGDAQ